MFVHSFYYHFLYLQLGFANVLSLRCFTDLTLLLVLLVNAAFTEGVLDRGGD